MESIQNIALEAVKVSGGTGNQLVNPAISGPGAYGLKIEMGVEDFTVSGGSIQDTDVGIGFATDGASITVSGAAIQNCRAGIEFLENYMVNVDLTGSTYQWLRCRYSVYGRQFQQYRFERNCSGKY